MSFRANRIDRIDRRKRFQRRSVPKRGRVLTLETMEPRQMMAADSGISFIAAEDTGQVSLSSIVQSRSGDAGSTRATAFDLGNLGSSQEDSRSLNGRVGWGDVLDVFEFEVSREAAVDVDLRNLRRDVDLLVFDADGRGIAASQSPGRSDESLSLDLSAGTYFIAVQSRSFWGSTYELHVAAELAPAPEPEPTRLAEPERQPEGAPAGNADPLTPLSDVSYFGSRLDWNVNAVNAPEAWAAGYTGEGILVAVIDTGVDLDHPDLFESIYVNPGEIAGDGIDNDGNGYIDDVHGYDFVAGDADPDDVNGHGTHVAGTIAAGNNGFGSTGIAHGASILPVRVLGDDGSGSTNAVAAGIRYAADLGADIINLSLGGGYSRAIDAAISYAQSVGSFIVAAAGNESAAVPGFPARFSATDTNVISVGAHDQSGRIAGFSNDVGGSRSIQIDAPGVGIYSTYVGGRYASLSGTSMASPHVAGVAALALSANPRLTPEQLRSLLTGGVTNSAIGSDALGTLNAATTVAFAAAGLTSTPGNGLAGAARSASTGNASTVRATNVDVSLADTSDSGLVDNDDEFAFAADPTLVGTANLATKTASFDSPDSLGSPSDASVAAIDAYHAESNHEPDPSPLDAPELGSDSAPTIRSTRSLV